MKFTALMLGVILAVLVISSVASASFFDIRTGLQANTPDATNWAGIAHTQYGNNGWTYRNGPTVYPWTSPWGASYAFTANLTDWALMGWEHAYSSGNDAYGWSAQTASGVYGATAASGTVGYICNSNETCEQINNSAAMGTTVAFRNGWNTSWFDQVAAVWTASSAGTADAAFTCYSANTSNNAMEFHLGVFRNGVFDSQLGWVAVVGTTNTGVGNGVALSATGISLAAGDSIVLASRSNNYGAYGNNAKQDNGAVSGGITFTAGGVVPEPGSLLALGSGLVGLLGFAIRRRK